MALSRYAGVFNANAFAYGIAGSGGPGPLVISNGFSAGSTSAQAVTLEWGQTSMSDGTILVPLNTNAPITAGSGTNGETVTLPTGFLNYVGRTLRIKGNLVMTSSSNTGTITVPPLCTVLPMMSARMSSGSLRS